MKSIFHSAYRDYGIGLCLWLFIFVLYLQTIAKTVGFIDSGELATVPFVLGIAHPTGYPFWTLLAHVFSSLPVASEEIVRLNIFSAFVTSLAAVEFFFTMLLLFRHGKKTLDPADGILPALFASLALAFSQTFWDQSTSIEVYALHLFLLNATMLFFLRAVFSYRESRAIDQRKWWLFAFTLGLSFTNHLTTILLAPAFLFLYFEGFRSSREGIKELFVLALPFLLGLSVYIYFPVRAVQQPVLDWGYPATLERILWHISGKQYRVWMFSSSEAAAKQWDHFINAVPLEFFYIPLLFSLLGAWRLLREERRTFLFIALLLAGCIAYTINYDIHDIDSYFLLAYIALAMFAGFGAVEAMTMFRKSAGKIGVGILLVCVVVAEISANWSDVDASGNELVQDYTANIFSTLKPHSIIISYQWDYFVSASYYFQYVKHLRTDVTVIDKELLRRSWYFLQMKKNHPLLYEKSGSEIEGFIEELNKFERDVPYDPAVIESRYNRMIDSFADHNIDSVAIYVTPEIEPHLFSHYVRVPEGLSYRLYRDTLYHPFDFPDFSYHPYNKQDSYTQQLRGLYTRMLVQRALYEERHGYHQLTTRYLQKAYEIDPNAGTLDLLRRFSASPAFH